MRKYISFSFITLMFVVFISSSLKGETNKTRSSEKFLQNFEDDRTSAGLWVEKNTPKHFKLLTFYGNPAFFSKRFTIDGSNLNAKYEADHIVKDPEIIIMENANKTGTSRPGSNELAVHNHPSKDKYEVVKTFFKTWSNGMNFYITVMARKDVLDQITDKSNVSNIPLLINYTDYRFTSKDDEYASVGSKGVWGLKIHGPAEGSIVLKADPCKMIQEAKVSSDAVTLKFSVYEQVSEYLKDSSAQKPLASLGVVSRVGNNVSNRKIVDYNNSQSFTVDCTDPASAMEFVIDNNQSPAFDWLEVSADPED